MITDEMIALRNELVPKCRKLLALSKTAKNFRDMHAIGSELYIKYNFIYAQVITEFYTIRNTLHNEVYSKLDCEEWFLNKI